RRVARPRRCAEWRARHALERAAPRAGGKAAGSRRRFLNLGHSNAVLRDQKGRAEKPPPTRSGLMPINSVSAAAPFTHKRNETMSAKIDEARKLGSDMLAKHGEPTQALPHFISALHRRKLFASVALDFLENLGRSNAVPLDQKGRAETAAADQLDDDAQYTNVGGGTPIDNLGHTGAALTG